jgi:molybdopterin-guanine dinucleotide biosynthesis protein A
MPAGLVSSSASRSRLSLLGVVLCGGESKRMGRDKGLITKEGIPWAVRMGNLLAQQQLAVIYSIHTEQQITYSSIIAPELLVTDRTERLGPREGLLSVHEKFPDRDLLLLSCDTPDMDFDTLNQLIDTYIQIPEYDFYAYAENIDDPYTIQPFCCIYTQRGLQTVQPDSGLKQGRSKGLKTLFQTDRLHLLRIENIIAFKNYNNL